jgi:hypothetical protein
MSLPEPSRYRHIAALRNENSNAAKNANFGGRFQQDIEPAGRYFIEADPSVSPSGLPQGWRRFEINFNNPMVIEWNTNPNGGYDDTSWKSVLYKLFKAKGKKLSLKLKAAGYDGIVTVRHGPGGWETSECVDLTVVH